MRADSDETLEQGQTKYHHVSSINKLVARGEGKHGRDVYVCWLQVSVPRGLSASPRWLWTSNCVGNAQTPQQSTSRWEPLHSWPAVQRAENTHTNTRPLAKYVWTCTYSPSDVPKANFNAQRHTDGLQMSVLSRARTPSALVFTSHTKAAEAPAWHQKGHWSCSYHSAPLDWQADNVVLL